MEKNKDCKCKLLLFFAFAVLTILALLLLIKSSTGYRVRVGDDITISVTELGSAACRKEQSELYEEQLQCFNNTIITVTSEDYSETVTFYEETMPKTTQDYLADITMEYPDTEEYINTNNDFNDKTTSQTTVQVTTEHIHSYVTSVSYINYPEEGHYEDVCVLDGYEEKVYESYDTYCYECGTIMDGWSFDQLLDHSAIHGAYGSYTQVVDVIWHEPVYEERWIVDREAYYEEVIEESCIECGYVK